MPAPVGGDERMSGEPEPVHGRRRRRRATGARPPLRSRRPRTAAGGDRRRRRGHRARHPARWLGAGHRRLPDRGGRPGAGGDRQPELGPGPAGPARQARARRRGPGRRGGHPHPPRPRRRGRATWPGPSPTPPSTSTRRGPAIWPTRPGWSTRPPGSTGRCSTRSTAGSTPPRPSGSTCSRTARRSGSAPPGRSSRSTRPGHAKHHLALHDTLSGVLFAGDAVGVKLPDAGVLRPSTPPPDFDLDLALNSLRRFAERRPTGLALAHYGLLADPLDVLDEADGTLRRWADVAESGLPQRRGHRRRAGRGVRLRPRRRARGAPGEARGDERRALQRRRTPALAVEPSPRRPTRAPTAAETGDGWLLKNP